MCVALTGIGVRSEDNGVGITVPGKLDDVMDALSKLASFTKEDLAAVENAVVALRTAKYDEFVPEALLRRFWARRNEAIIDRIPDVAGRLLTPGGRS
jgi:ATP-dependent Lhr-like helicase